MQVHSIASVFLAILHFVSGVNVTENVTPSLPALQVNRLLTVSGISAGGYMAVQFHVSYSRTVTAAGVVAGGPYWCAKDNVETALHACMKQPESINVEVLRAATVAAENVGSIDALENLQNAKLYFFSGAKDSVVHTGVMSKLVDYYQSYTHPSNIKTVFNMSAEHTFPTMSYGNPCTFLGSPYIGNCGYDAAYDILSNAWEGIKRAGPNTSLAENLIEFSQAPYFLVDPALVSSHSLLFWGGRGMKSCRFPWEVSVSYTFQMPVRMEIYNADCI
eukprot:m.52814 g.52814  ORF g.52814 m.52814 type:complete len:275 (-) comp10820_c0_seq2:1516-2340(-)